MKTLLLALVVLFVTIDEITSDSSASTSESITITSETLEITAEASDYKPINEMTFDLSYPYDNSTPHWPNAMGFKFVKKIVRDDEAAYWYAANDFCVGEHAGTHLDAPYHFNKNGWKVADIPINKLINRAYVLDVEEMNNEQSTPNTTLQASHIKQFEKKQFGLNGTLPGNVIILIRFNWGQYYGTDKYYNLVAKDEPTGEMSLSFPGISAEAAELLVIRKIAGLGVDTASVDMGSSATFDSHRIFAKSNVFSMENVKLPKELADYNDNLVVYALPMNILEGTGGPLRVVAVVPRRTPIAPLSANFSRDYRNAKGAKIENSGIVFDSKCWVIICCMFLQASHLAK